MKHPADRTAGLNSELAVEMIGNRYNLILAGARRMRELSRGDMPKITCFFRNFPKKPLFRMNYEQRFEY